MEPQWHGKNGGLLKMYFPAYARQHPVFSVRVQWGGEGRGEEEWGGVCFVSMCKAKLLYFWKELQSWPRLLVKFPSCLMLEKLALYFPLGTKKTEQIRAYNVSKTPVRDCRSILVPPPPPPPPRAFVVIDTWHHSFIQTVGRFPSVNLLSYALLHDWRNSTIPAAPWPAPPGRTPGDISPGRCAALPWPSFQCWEPTPAGGRTLGIIPLRVTLRIRPNLFAVNQNHL